MNNYKQYDISIIDCQSNNNQYGDPDDGCPQDALEDYLNDQKKDQEVVKGEHSFEIWQDEDEEDIFHANAWSLPKTGNKSEYTTYYQFKVGERK